LSIVNGPWTIDNGHQNNSMKKYLTAIVVVIAMQATAQDLSFSQFYEKPLLRNPALAGVFDGDIRVNGIFRNQWQSVTVPYQTAALSAEIKFPIGSSNDFLTLGIQTTYDVAGDIKLKRTQILPVINYHKSLNEDYDSYLSFAFMGGSVNSQFDATKLKMDDQYVAGSFNASNPTQQVFSKTGVSYWDAATGVTYSQGFGESGSWYLGAALFHFNKPKVAFYTNNESTVLLNKLTFNAGVTTPTSEYNRLVLFGDYTKQGGSNQFCGGALYGTDLVQQYDGEDKVSFYAGAFYRWKDALVPIIKLDYYNMAVGLSYDVNVSKLKTASQLRGGFELSLSYRAKFNSRGGAAGDKMRCVKFVF
jgi:type IX secretion system PorP/SprF family membrane protein